MNVAFSHQLAVGPAANIEGWVQVGELGLGLLLSAVIGLEREIRLADGFTDGEDGGLRRHEHVGHQFPPRICRMTRVIAPASGRAASSSGFAYGSDTSAEATRRTGASR